MDKVTAIGIESEGVKAVGLGDDDSPKAYPKDTLFKTYNITVRLAGDIMFTVAKENVTARTIALLQKIHGVGGVVDIKETGTVMLNATEHYYELALDYSKTLNPAHGLKQVEQTFGVNLVGFTNWYNNRMLEIDSRREMVTLQKNRESAAINAGRDKSDAEIKAKLSGDKVDEIIGKEQAVGVEVAPLTSGSPKEETI